MYSYVMHEYVYPHTIIQDDVFWTIEYEPVEKTPIVNGSFVGVIYNGDNASTFYALDGSIRGNSSARGWIDENVGAITIVFFVKPHDEHYLCVCYESGDEIQKADWLQEGF
jgi:hypothetical protein